MIAPKLLAEQFDDQGTVSITVPFAGKTFTVVCQNKSGKDFGDYTMESALCDDTVLPVQDNASALLSRELLDSLPDGAHRIIVNLI